MVFTTFLVTLDPELPVYVPGQAVNGYLTVACHEEVSCRSIKITIKGQSKVHWSEKSGKSRRHYRAGELYFRHPILVWGGEGSGNSFSPGYRKFPFSFILPRDIPSSFVSNIGKVMYQVKAEADLPWSFDKSHKVFFSVNFMYDLNLDPFATIPMVIQKEDTVCCCCCAEGPIEMNMRAQRSGYVSGESILVNGDVMNNTSSTIEYTEIKLIQVTTYITKAKQKQIERTVQRVYHPQLGSRCRDVWENVPLPIPAVPASHLKHCNIITIQYIFVLLAKFGTCKTVKAKVPVIVGSLPLQNTYSSFLVQPSAAEIGGTTMTVPINHSPRHSPRHSPAVPSHSHPPSAPSPTAPPYSGDPPPYTENFLPEEFREVRWETMLKTVTPGNFPLVI
ncbi:arrestin domain-containing protein 3-like isoform X2 [Portunus trituberculatus]|uniref:arrestin domain-containing protein 3-like isoform X2 n=1 Tax=Portunus trituberculatus TaxID=210409 RepID=UPI001E1CB268|nr:arrestin domain-containing protein 3-like isoform X2 [Portunus trituberculatus]XP_045104857.1 arrestin domain-containing protein 3-like isoform X2 [Portunus trituberculatus]